MSSSLCTGSPHKLTADLTQIYRAKHRRSARVNGVASLTQNAQRPDEIERPGGVHHVGVGRAHLPVLPLHFHLRRLSGTHRHISIDIKRNFTDTHILMYKG